MPCPSFFVCIDFHPPSPVGPPPSFSVSHFASPVSCYSPIGTPSTLVPLYFPSFCNYSMLYPHIWGFGGRNYRQARTYSNCRSGSGLPHSAQSCLDPFIYLPISWFPFLYCCTNMPAAKGSNYAVLSSFIACEPQQHSTWEDIHKDAISDAHMPMVKNSYSVGLQAHSTEGKSWNHA